eukprot:TRINITY_DN721_c4_g2_i2.p1 TRINITY_DN721_c4_g2~~TRINITY_DN721_c4_g2_i2.p1  ORF type:complete len:724 (+),score=272.31 TRINITY_DN721_c4_g2_i2:304-2172(+)
MAQVANFASTMMRTPSPSSPLNHLKAGSITNVTSSSPSSSSPNTNTNNTAQNLLSALASQSTAAQIGINPNILTSSLPITSNTTSSSSSSSSSSTSSSSSSSSSSTTNTVSRGPGIRLTFRELARQQSEGIPAETFQHDIPTLTQEEVLNLQNTKQMVEHIQNLQQNQEKQLSEIKSIQLQLLSNSSNNNNNNNNQSYDHATTTKSRERLNDMMKHIQMEIQKLMEITKTVVVDADLLHMIRQLVHQITNQSHQVDLFLKEISDDNINYFKKDTGGLGFKSVAKLVITEQPLPHVMFKGKMMEGSYTVSLLTGASDHFSHISEIQATLIAEGVNYKSKKPIENGSSKLDSFQKQAIFNNMKVNVSTRMTMVSVKFNVDVTSADSKTVVESPTSYPFIVITNESQWVEAASKVIIAESFPSGQSQVPWAEFANTLQIHFLSATRQDCSMPERPLQFYEIKWFHQKINGCSPMITQQQSLNFLSWFGNIVRTIRFKRHIIHLWCLGLVYCFQSKEMADKALANQSVGTFLLRFSESQPGLFGVAFVTDDEVPEDRVKHYLIKSEDIGSNKSLPDFLRDVESLQFILKTEPVTGKLIRMEKDVAFKKFYSKRKPTKTKGYASSLI